MCAVQFQEQSAALRSGDGQDFGHYHGAQFGSKRLATADGKVVLTAHSLFTVDVFAYDMVRLRGAYPKAVSGKYVDLTMEQWQAMFKIVYDSNNDHARRLVRAETHYLEYAQPTVSTHPSYQYLPKCRT